MFWNVSASRIFTFGIDYAKHNSVGMHFVLLVSKLNNMYTFITLKQLREIRNLTQNYVASQIGVTQSAYSKIENFDCQTSIENYEKIAALLNVDVDQVICNKIQALIHIKSSSHKELVANINLPKVTALINNIKEQEFKLNKLIQMHSLEKLS